jgi:hypothetical protein
MGDVDGFAGGTMKGAGARAGCAMSGVVGATIGVAGGMMGRAELGGAAVEALATAVREMLSRRIDGGALSALISEPWPCGVYNIFAARARVPGAFLMSTCRPARCVLTGFVCLRLAGRQFLS